MEKSKKKKYLIAGIVFTICIMIGTSYAWWTSSANQKGINEIQSTCIHMELENEQDAIRLENAYPLTDEEAKKLTPYTFTIKNTCNTMVDYTVKLEKLSNDENKDKILDSKYVAVEFNGGQKQILSEYPEGEETYKENEGYTSIEARNLIKGTLQGEETKKYSIKLWMDEHVTIKDDAMNKSFVSKIIVDGSINEIAQYDEPILHGADPVLESNKPVAMLTASGESTITDKLIPVIINEEDGTVTRANTSHDWYNYEEKRWANAVILVDGVEEPDAGEKIDESQIESYFVWIPKYRYKLFNMGKYEDANGPLDENFSQLIEIQFGLIDTTDNDSKSECATPKASGEDGECDVGKWMTHPAFLAFDTNGLWVGKFETGYNGVNSSSDAEKHNEVAEDKIIIKPNVYSWRNITVGNVFKTAKDYEPTLVSHMIKNTEWGAVAYLSHSIYGTCTGNSCAEIMINNSSNYVTGVSAKNEPTLGYQEYNDYIPTTPSKDNAQSNVYPRSQNASTTGNNTGIFDMDGGAWEKVAGVITNKSETTTMDISDIVFLDSGLTKEDITDLKYVDLYAFGESIYQYSRRILGDAIGEMGPFIKTNNSAISSWHKDDAYFVNSSNSWVIRGGPYYKGCQSGIFGFVSNRGEAASTTGFRIVLTP